MTAAHDSVSTRQEPIQVIYRDRESLRLDSTNPRRHSAKQVRQLAKSIKTFGFTTPILVDRDLQVIGGHGRLAASETLGITEVPTISLDHLSPAQARAYMIADNRLTEIATWDDTLLAEHLKTLNALDLDFDLDVIGFDMPEIELRIQGLADVEGAGTKTQLEEELDPLPLQPASQVGDLWRLDRHLLLCGNALDGASYEQLLSNELADVVFTDPPYNVPIAGHASGLGRNQHPDFIMASGEMAGDEFTEFLNSVSKNMVRHSRDGSVHYICMDWRHIRELSAAGSKNYSELKNICVWVKTNAGMGSFYRSQHELIFVFKSGNAPHRNNVQLGRFGRNRSNVWTYPGASTPTGGDEEKSLLDLHPTVKPAALVADALMDCTDSGAIVLDPFAGSGTTIIAAERTGRVARAIEIDPRYVDVAIRRWQKFTRKAAVHAVTGRPLDNHEKE